MTRTSKIALAAAGVVFGLPLFGLGTVTVAANTEPGRHAIEQVVSWVSDGRIKIDGLSGRFPGSLRVRQIALSDQAGTWLTIEQARLDWSPSGLVYGDVQVATLAATRVSVARLAETSTTSTKSSHAIPPVSIAVNDFHVDRLDLAAPVAGVAASVGVKGNLHLKSLTQGNLALDVERLDGAGIYQMSGTIAPNAMTGRIDVSEPMHGLLASIIGLPDLGPLSISASLNGPHHAEHMRLSLSAGPLAADAQGTIDLVGKTLDMALTGSAPAMVPRPDLSWRSVRLDGHVQGSFTSPIASGHFAIEALKAGDIGVGQFGADLDGHNGTIDLTASVAGLRVPGSQPDLFAAAPFTLHAEAVLNVPNRPVTFALSHPLISASGHADTGGAPTGSMTVSIPDLAPYAAIAGENLRGHADLTAKFAQRNDAMNVGVDGAIGATGGFSAVTSLIGERTTFSLAGVLQDQNVAIDKFALDGKTLHVSAAGSRKNDVIDCNWSATLSNLSDIAPPLAGTLAAHGHVHGPSHDVAMTAQAIADVATAGSPKEPLTVSLQAQGLPVAPSGSIEAHGRLAGASLELAAAVNRQNDGTLEFSLDRLHWKSASGQGKVTLSPGASVPTGHVQFRMARFDDLAPLMGMTVAGNISAAFDTLQVQGAPQARVQAEMGHLQFNGDHVDRLTADARIANPMKRPLIAATVGVEGIQWGPFTGNAQLSANGPPDSLALRVSSNLQTPRGPARLSATATADLPGKNLRLASLQATGAGETAHLLAPAKVSFATGLSVDQLRLGVNDAVIALAGRMTPTLALTVSARNVNPALAEPFLPGFNGSGTIALSGQLHGTLAAPEGTIRLTGRHLQITEGGVAGLPPADIDATAIFAQGTARLRASLTSGSNLHLQLAGTAPLRPTAPFDLRLSGNTDLVVLDPLLTPNGRAARGQVALDLGVTGTMAAPRATGTIRLVSASVQDFVQGIAVTDLNGLIRADGDTLHIVNLSGRAGGTVSIAGTIGIFQPELPIALTVTAQNARLPSSDLLSATISADITVRGALRQTLSVGGTVHVAKADINIPDSLPKDVAVLNVRRPGAKPAAPPTLALTIMLALVIDAPEQVFVRGHGVDAEMGGTLKIGGTAATPVINGGFDLRRGTYSLAGQTLNFTKGKVAFGGTGLTNKLNPTIDFVADNTANGVTATLTITGYADAPKIQLSSSPDMPQDEILAHLLFGQSVKQLSPFQVAEIAQAIASLSGSGGSNPLASVRKGLGLDRLTVGSASGGGGASAEAGKYVANGVYVGTKHNMSGGSQAQVQVDLTKRLKLQSTVGTGGTPVTGATIENDPGSNIGLSYQFEY